ncbi:hypothetical protein FAF44_45450 [Nonomuraea sp. MG754425]|uniref:SGNH/GDSL hydrolase N-terminal domain-containing protein n=1 Tax=Nonomuraea sp. MG754425 TaxID=2570319 RepID=UPI001F2FFCCA|nr:SGNH/GDSL hydrolase N-terminal domain-containing protein [Nonomuraea sp. MG754425]MCF6475551.1 hypothetical protein [Nonomuraea sp. MG754425]
MVNRRHLFGLAGAGGAALALPGLLPAPAHATPQPAATWPTEFVEVTPTVEGGIAWYDVSHWGVEGKGWSDTAAFYDRLPARAEAVVSKEVWVRSRHSAGLSTRFVSNSTIFRARYRLNLATTAMYHMPAIGHSGVDLYARTEAGQDAWLANTHPTAQAIDQQMGIAVDPGERLYTAYLPLYNGPQQLQIGVEAGCCVRRGRTAHRRARRLLRQFDHAGRRGVPARHVHHGALGPPLRHAHHQPGILRQRADAS